MLAFCEVSGPMVLSFSEHLLYFLHIYFLPVKSLHHIAVKAGKNSILSSSLAIAAWSSWVVEVVFYWENRNGPLIVFLSNTNSEENCCCCNLKQTDSFLRNFAHTCANYLTDYHINKWKQIRNSMQISFVEQASGLLTHCGRVKHICVGKQTIIVLDNGLSPGRRQAIIWTNAGILLIGPLGTNFSESLIAILTFSFKKIHLNMSSAKWRPFCLGLNVLTHCGLSDIMSVNWVIIGSGNGLMLHRCQAVTWISDDFLPVGPLGTNFSKISIKIQLLSFMERPLKVFFFVFECQCIGFNVFTLCSLVTPYGDIDLCQHWLR